MEKNKSIFFFMLIGPQKISSVSYIHITFIYTIMKFRADGNNDNAYQCQMLEIYTDLNLLNIEQ